MNIFLVKGCKRCGGDLFLENDPDGDYVTCLQCGAVYVQLDESVAEEIEKMTVGAGNGKHYRK